jgi:hypothetical protein
MMWYVLALLVMILALWGLFESYLDWKAEELKKNLSQGEVWEYDLERNEWTRRK